MKIAHTSTPVTVLASPHHGALAVTRSLGRLGIPVFNVGADRWSPAFLSRYSRRRLLWNVDEAPPEESCARLMKWGLECGCRSILMATTDGGANLIANYAEKLQEFFIFPKQPPALVRSLCSKKEMHRLACQYHVPAPLTFFPQTKDDLRQCRKALPLMIKGIEGRCWHRRSQTKLAVRSSSELLHLCDQIGETAVPELLVQEFIPGDEDTVWIFNGYFDEHSDCKAGFTGRKLRQCPAYTGVASLAVCEPNALLKQRACEFMKAVGYCGMVDIDFRFDARDGKYKMLDVNPRIGSTFRLFVSNEGIDVVRAAYLDLTGQPLPPSHTPNGRKWIVEDLDLVTSLRYWRDGKLSVPDWLRSLRGIDEYSFLSLDDPLPLLAMLRADVSELRHRVRPPADALPPFTPKSPAEAVERSYPA